jgi:hypothetical protein
MQRRFYITLIISVCWIQNVSAYGVLSHQAVVDAAWEESIKPLLKHKYSNATAEEIKKAHAYAYGGSIVQDMGYFPFGNVFFTDLLHYVRSGDFVENLISSSENINELAFALGALAHYNADIYGHPLGTNKAISLVYPKIKKEYGTMVTYADDPASHIKTEFGFDVLQVARGNYAPESYKDFIGFEVASEVLERAFLKTYGLELKKVFLNLPLAIGSYRYTIKGLMPDLTKAAWQAKKSDIQEVREGVTQRQFIYRMSNTDYKKEWGNTFEKPNLIARTVAWIIRVLPKIGPLKPLAFVPPTPEAEELFMKSFNVTVENYKTNLKYIKDNQRAKLQNLQLDTGKPTAFGDYPLTDKTYAELLVKLADSDFEHVSPSLRQNILGFYKNGKEYTPQKEDGEKWGKAEEALSKLKSIQ